MIGMWILAYLGITQLKMSGEQNNSKCSLIILSLNSAWQKIEMQI